MKYIRRVDGSLFFVQTVRKKREGMYYSLLIGGKDAEDSLEWSFELPSERDKCIEEMESFLEGEDTIRDEVEIYEAALVPDVGGVR